MLNLRIFCRHPPSLQDLKFDNFMSLFHRGYKRKDNQKEKKHSVPDIQKSLNGNFVLLIKIILMINND